MNSLNKLSYAEIILRTNRLKRELLKYEELSWTDLLVLCTLRQIEENSILNTPQDLIKKMNMNRCWIYRSIRKLHAKKYIYVNTYYRAASHITVSGWGIILLQRVGDILETERINDCTT